MLAMLHFDESPERSSGDLMARRVFCGRSLQDERKSTERQWSSHGTYFALAMRSAIIEYLHSVDRFTHAIQLGLLLSHCRIVRCHGFTCGKRQASWRRYLCLAVNTFSTAEGRFVALLLWASDAVNVWRQQSFAAVAKARAVGSLGRVVEGRVRPGQRTRRQHRTRAAAKRLKSYYP